MPKNKWEFEIIDLKEISNFFTSCAFDCLNTTLNKSVSYDTLDIKCYIEDDFFECISVVDKNGLVKHTKRINKLPTNLPITDYIQEWNSFEFKIQFIINDFIEELKIEANFFYDEFNDDQGTILIDVESPKNCIEKIKDAYFKIRGMISHELCHAIQRNVYKAKFKKSSQEIPAEHACDKHEIEARIEEVISASHDNDVYEIKAFSNYMRIYLEDYVKRNNILTDNSKINLEKLLEMHTKIFRRKYDH